MFDWENVMLKLLFLLPNAHMSVNLPIEGYIFSFLFRNLYAVCDSLTVRFDLIRFASVRIRFYSIRFFEIWFGTHRYDSMWQRSVSSFTWSQICSATFVCVRALARSLIRARSTHIDDLRFKWINFEYACALVRPPAQMIPANTCLRVYPFYCEGETTKKKMNTLKARGREAVKWRIKNSDEHSRDGREHGKHRKHAEQA